MKRLLPALLGLSLLLTACPGAAPEVPVPTGESVLDGLWQGTLREESTTAAVSASPELVFDLRGVGENQRVTVRRLRDGAVLAERSFPGGGRSLAWRADGTLDGALLLGVDRSWQRLDPETLAVQEERPLPAALLGFSADGTVARLADGTRLDTRTGEALTPAPNTFEWLQTSDDSWRLAEDGEKATRLADGFTVSLDSQHGNPCRTLGGPGAIRLETLPDGGLAVGYTDTVLELRAPDGTLRRAVRLDDSCVPVQAVRRWGDELSVAAWNGTSGDLTLHSLTAAGELLRPAAALVVNTQAFRRLPVPSGVVSGGGGVPPQAALRDATGWTVPLGTLPLTLDLRAEYVSGREYRFTGTARLAGETFALAGKAHASAITLKPAGVPEIVSWEADLTGADGSSGRRLFGTHGARGARQSVSYRAGDATYQGELRHP